MFGICRLIDIVVPDIPESLDIKIKRERFLAKQALQEAEHVLQASLNNLLQIFFTNIASICLDGLLSRDRESN